MAFKLNTAVLGGTFDHFHKGHQKLIDHGLLVCERLIVGISSDRYVSNLKFKIQNSEFFEDFKTRKKAVEDYLNKIAQGRFEIVEIDDMYGPTLDKNFQADVIIVSSQTKKGAQKINRERLKKRLSKLKIIEIEPVLAEDGELISSQRIRNGEIDRKGRLYIKPQWLTKDLLITEELKEVLRKPQGDLIKEIKISDLESSGFIISVGDQSTKILNNLGVKPQISVIDFKIAREKRFSDIKELGLSGMEKIYAATNPAGTVSKEMFKTAQEIFENVHDNNQIVLVDGEDDLSVLPFALASPLGVTIFYGQPQEGMVKILVTEKSKAKIKEIVAEFNTRGY